MQIKKKNPMKLMKIVENLTNSFETILGKVSMSWWFVQQTAVCLTD